MKHNLINCFRLAIFVCIVLYANVVAAEWRSTSFDSMGTRFELELWAANDKKAQKIYNAVSKELQGLESLLSPYIESSDVSRINASAGDEAVVVDEITYRIIERSLRYSRLSEGAFDISFAALGQQYDYRNNLQPDDTNRRRGQQLIDYRQIELSQKPDSNNKVFYVLLKKSGMAIDLGGIAKGFAIDTIAELLLREGIVAAAISLGGDSRFIGDRGTEPLSNKRIPWMIGIKHPRANQLPEVRSNIEKESSAHALRMPLINAAFSTSGDYERYFIDDSGTRVHHIIDTATGQSAKEVVSVSIVGEKSIDCDALSTTVFVLGIERGLELIESINGYDAIIIDRQGKIHYSSGLG